MNSKENNCKHRQKCSLKYKEIEARKSSLTVMNVITTFTILMEQRKDSLYGRKIDKFQKDPIKVSILFTKMDD